MKLTKEIYYKKTIKELEMGVDCKIIVPSYVSSQDIANIIFISSNHQNPIIKDNKINNLQGAINKSTFSQDCFDITFSDLIQTNRYVLFHRELIFQNTKNFQYGKGISPRSTGFWISIGKRIVNVFGGEICYSDSSDIHYTIPGMFSKNDLLTLEGIQKKNEFICKLGLLTASELLEAEKEAAYNDDELEKTCTIYTQEALKKHLPKPNSRRKIKI